VRWTVNSFCSIDRYPPILVQVYGRPHPGPLPNCTASSLYTTRHLHRE
jgi:hypothetical protein